MKLNASGISGAFGVFPIFNNLVSRKRQERNIHLNLYVIQFYVGIVCHLVKQSAKGARLFFFFFACLFVFRYGASYLSDPVTAIHAGSFFIVNCELILQISKSDLLLTFGEITWPITNDSSYN